jgi:putative ATPase
VTLFEDDARAAPTALDAPLAARMRPRTLAEVLGQEHLLGPGKPLRLAIERDALRSAIFFGPPGCGKSTLASVIATVTKSHFASFSAVTGGVADVRKLIDAARERKRLGKKTLLFVDEIHRFNKAQQDAFLPHVEDGTVTLIGATTENPFFSIVAPLLSRARVYPLQPIPDSEILALLQRALTDPERGLGAANLTLTPDAADFLAATASGDARRALGMLELAADLAPSQISPPLLGGGGQNKEAGGQEQTQITLEVAEEAVGRKALRYDKTGDNHYDFVSAFIKSMRGSDPDASVYWLARMLEAGEDPRFLARRLVIFASEDIGCADPQALPLAMAAYGSAEKIGMPECALNLSHATIYLACAPKSNACTTALGRVKDEIEKQPFAGVPAHLRDGHSKGKQALTGAGVGYKYPHDFPEGFVKQQYLPDGLPVSFPAYYEPKESGIEAKIATRLARLWADDEKESV